MPDLREALNSGRVILMDGAMGTELQRAGLKDGECGELWNLTRPDAVADIHRRFVLAGAQCLVTNTFQANPAALAKHGIDELEAINREAVLLARSVAGPNRFVLASIGPIWFRSWDDTDNLSRVVRSLEGADGLLFETWSNIFASRACLPGINPEAIPVVVSFAYHKRFLHGPILVPDRIEQSRLTAIGVNCGRDIGMAEMAYLLGSYRQAIGLPLLARPNAGTPKRKDDAWVYPRTPEAMAARLPELIDAGATLIGGCCGTTPAHIAAFRQVIDRLGVGWRP